MNRRMFSCIAAQAYASRTCCGAFRYWIGQMPRVGFAPSGGIALAVELGLVCETGVHADASTAAASTKKRRRLTTK